MFIPSLHDNTLLEDIINSCQSNSRLCFWCIVRRRFEPPSSSFYRHTLNMAKVHLLAFFPTPHFWQQFFDDITPSQIRDKRKNEFVKVSYLFMFRRLQNNIMLFCKKQICKQYQAGWNIWYQKEFKEKWH